jgi:hypothetical protein
MGGNSILPSFLRGVQCQSRSPIVRRRSRPLAGPQSESPAATPLPSGLAQTVG